MSTENEHKWVLLPSDQTWTNVWSIMHWGYWLSTFHANHPYYIFECKQCETRISRSYREFYAKEHESDHVDESKIPSDLEIQMYFEKFCLQSEAFGDVAPWIYMNCAKTKQLKVIRLMHEL